MRRLHWFLVFLIVLGHTTKSHAQAWAGIIEPSRAVDWSRAGTSIPTRTTICATLNPGASSSQTSALLDRAIIGSSLKGATDNEVAKTMEPNVMRDSTP